MTNEQPAYPTIPSEEAPAGRMLSIPGAVIQKYSGDDVFEDIVRWAEPELILPAPPEAGVVKPTLTSVTEAPIIRPGRGMQPETITTADGQVHITITPTLEDLPPNPIDILDETPQAGAAPNAGDTKNHRFCLVTESLSLSVNPHNRTAELENITNYLEALPDAWISGSVTHFSTQLRPDYATTYSASERDIQLTVHGAGSSTAQLGAGTDSESYQVALLEIHPNGAVKTTATTPDRFGLRGLTGVSNARASALRKAGFTTRKAIAEATQKELTAVANIGDKTAATIKAQARAMTEQNVIPTGEGSLPEGQPVFIDIETDGFAASTAWLIGVLDGDSETGTYLPFRQEAPRASGDHLEVFMAWLTGSASGRPIVAWNGYGFDFAIIREQLHDHCPEYLDEWDNRYLFDPYQWAVEQGNAALPSRTNKLEDVATALGWKPATKGLDGGSVADIFTTWRANALAADTPSDVPPPDWNRLEAYCEDDVRALAAIYDALKEAARRPPETPTDPEQESTQGSLSDFT